MRLERLCLVAVVAALPGFSAASFEPVSQSPWVQGGCASTLFARSALSVVYNPALAGLLEGRHAAVSYSRPFGLDRLDRGAIAGTCPLGGFVPGASITASGDGSYSEMELSLSAAWRCVPGLVLGLSSSLEHLSIDEYGAASGFAAGAGLVFTPVRGVIAASSVRGALRTDLGSSGDPSVPRSFDLSAGACPVERLLVSAGFSKQEGLDPEYSFAMSFSPPGPVTIGVGYLTDPGRFGFSAAVSLGDLQFLYGLATHPALEPTHSAEVAWGRPFAPPPLSGPAPEESGAASGGPPYDPNTATIDQLCEIPGIGPARAEAIVSWREQHGPFGSVEDLLEIPGIGPSMLPTLESYLVIE